MIKDYRIRNKLTQEEIAETLNISTRHYQRIESDFRNTTIEILLKIIKILKISDKDIIKMLRDEI